MTELSLTNAEQIAGPLGYPSKMPGTSYGLSARRCITGTKLHNVEGSTCESCYALRGNYLHQSVEIAHAKRHAGVTNPQWINAVVRMLRHMHSLDKDGKPRKGRNGPITPGWHRWHDSGDLQSVEHLANICEVATQTPNIWHWLPTREGGILKRYVTSGGIVPENLCIRLSATMIDSAPPRSWPTTSGVHDQQLPQGLVCSAPEHDGHCADCRACWNRDVAYISYHKH